MMTTTTTAFLQTIIVVISNATMTAMDAMLMVFHKNLSTVETMIMNNKYHHQVMVMVDLEVDSVFWVLIL